MLLCKLLQGSPRYIHAAPALLMVGPRALFATVLNSHQSYDIKMYSLFGCYSLLEWSAPAVSASGITDCWVNAVSDLLSDTIVRAATRTHCVRKGLNELFVSPARII